MIRQDDLEMMRAVAESGRSDGDDGTPAPTDAEVRRAVLATIVSTRGSTPRKAGSKMLVRPDGTLLGTVGGGCGEGEVLEAAARVAAGGECEMVRVDLTEDLLTWSPAVCGGIMDVLVEPVRRGPLGPADGGGAEGDRSAAGREGRTGTEGADGGVAPGGAEALEGGRER